MNKLTSNPRWKRELLNAVWKRPKHEFNTSTFTRTSTRNFNALTNVQITHQQRLQNSSARRTYKTISSSRYDPDKKSPDKPSPGSVAFAECETVAITDLFYQFARNDHSDGEHFLTPSDVRKLLDRVGERPDDRTLKKLFKAADTAKDGKLSLSEFLVASDAVLGGAPASLVIVVGGPGSGKGILCKRLVEECGVVHLSSGDLLRDEVESGTPLGREVAAIMERGELVSSAVITALIRRHTRNFPGKRVLLDGFPRSVENAADFLDLMGTPELALHLECDDTILMERIIKRGREGEKDGNVRADDNIDTALQRVRTFHKYHKPTMDWLREQHVPIVNLDCSGTHQNVFNQLLAIGRLMRPTAQKVNSEGAANGNNTSTLPFFHDEAIEEEHLEAQSR